MNLNRYIQIIIGIILLAGVILSSSAGGAEDGNGALIAGNAGDEGTSLITLAGSLLDTATGSLNTENSLPISETGPAIGGMIYEGPSSDEGPFEYTIIGSAGGGGTITPSGQVSVQSGDNASFSITPDSGYEIRSVLIDGEDYGAVTGYTFQNVCADHQIEALFRSGSNKGGVGTLEGGTTGAQSSNQIVSDPLTTALPGSISKTAVITVASDPTFLTEGANHWQARKAHTIHNPKSTAQTNYMVRFIIHRTTGTDSGEDCYLGNLVQSDYRDLRFTTTANVAYDYIIERSDAQSATVWVTIPSLAVGEGIQMYIYYGCPAAAAGAGEGSISSAIFTEDFETSTAAWTVDSGCTLTRVADGSGGYVGRLVTVGSHTGANHVISELADLSGDLTIEYTIKPAQTSQWLSPSAYTGPTSTYGAYFFLSPSATFYTGPSPQSYFGSYAANQWYTIKLVFKPARTYDVYINNVLSRQDVALYGTGNLNCFAMRGFGTASKSADFDNIRVYRGASASPTPDAGVHFDWYAVEYDPEPVSPAFSFSPNPGIVYFPVFFTDESTGLITDWRWDYGDGSTATGTGSVSHTYLTEGGRTVTLEVKDITGSWSTPVSHPINVVASGGITWNGTISVKTGTDTTNLVTRIHSAATSGYNPVLDEYTAFPSIDKTYAALDNLYLKRAKSPIVYGSTATWDMNVAVPTGKTATITWTEEPLLTMVIKEGSTVKTSGFTAAAGSHTYTVTVKWVPYSLQLRQGWTMVSLPVVPDNGLVSVIFKDVTSGVTNPVRTWENNAFVAVTQLQPRKGYWVHSNNAINVPVSGTTISGGTYTLQKGWNMIGTPGVTTLDISTIQNQVSERPAKTWNGLTFETVTELEPGTAAWVFVTESS